MIRIRQGHLLKAPHPVGYRLRKAGCLPGNPFRDALCADFNGTDEYAYKDDPSWKSDTAGAFAIRMRADTLLGANGYRNIIAMGVNSGANASRMSIHQRRSASTSSQNRVALFHMGTHGGTQNLVHGNTALAATTWYSIVAQTTGSSWSLYLNGSSESTTIEANSNTGDWLGDLSGSSHRLVFGTTWNANAPSNYFDGRLNECIYVGGRVLTGAEITEWHNAGVTRNPHRLSFRGDIDSWWRFGDNRDSATTIYDEVGSNHLTLVNMDASNYVAP